MKNRSQLNLCSFTYKLLNNPHPEGLFNKFFPRSEIRSKIIRKKSTGSKMEKYINIHIQKIKIIISYIILVFCRHLLFSLTLSSFFHDYFSRENVPLTHSCRTPREVKSPDALLLYRVENIQTF